MKRFFQSKKIDKSKIQSWFKNCSDVEIKQLENNPSILLIYCDPLIDLKELRNHVLPYINKLEDDLFEKTEPSFAQSLPINKSLPDRLIQYVFEGKLIVILTDQARIFAMDIQKIPHRQIDQAVTESTIKGARDGFVEELPTNLGLIRKRIKTSSLKVKSFVLGERNKTKIALLYLEDVIPAETIADVSQRIEKIHVDGIISSTHLEELIQSKRPQLFPLVDYTGRPDFASNCLLQGRFIILVDGSPTAIIAPVSLPFLINSAEDQHVMFYQGSFSRILRYISLFISSFLPGLWIALITHHPDQLPYSLLATFALSRKGIPFPSSLEGLLIILLFELLREAGLRLPSAFGQTLSIVGGLIIGQAAISAGIASPGIIVVVAISVISTFTLVNQSLAGTVSYVRLFNYTTSSLLGLAGFYLSLFLIVVYMANLRSFHIPYLAPFAPIHSKEGFFQSFFRKPYQYYQDRPPELQNKDSTKKE